MTRVIFLLIVGVLLGSCGRAPEQAHGWAAHSARRHAEADHLLQTGRRSDAVGVLTALRDDLRQQEVAGQAAGRMALQDVYYRLGGLALQAGTAAQALEYCDQGLAVGSSDDLFTANLLVVRGRAHELLGHRTAAAEDLHQALLINEKLLDRTLEPR